MESTNPAMGGATGSNWDCRARGPSFSSSKDQTKDLLKFLKPYPDETKDLVLWVREWVWDLYPDANELIYDSYNALAFGWLMDGLSSTTSSSITSL